MKRRVGLHGHDPDAGQASRRRRPVPMKVPLVPRPATKLVTRLRRSASRISVPSPRSERASFAALLYWSGRSSGRGLGVKLRAVRIAPWPLQGARPDHLCAVHVQQPLALLRDACGTHSLDRDPSAFQHGVGDAVVAEWRPAGSSPAEGPVLRPSRIRRPRPDPSPIRRDCATRAVAWISTRDAAPAGGARTHGVFPMTARPRRVCAGGALGCDIELGHGTRLLVPGIGRRKTRARGHRPPGPGCPCAGRRLRP